MTPSAESSVQKFHLTIDCRVRKSLCLPLVDVPGNWWSFLIEESGLSRGPNPFSERGQLPRGGLRSTIPGLGQVGDGRAVGPLRPGWQRQDGSIHCALESPPDLLEPPPPLTLGRCVLGEGFEVPLERVHPRIRMHPWVAESLLVVGTDEFT